MSTISTRKLVLKWLNGAQYYLMNGHLPSITRHHILQRICDSSKTDFSKTISSQCLTGKFMWDQYKMLAVNPRTGWIFCFLIGATTDRKKTFSLEKSVNLFRDFTNSLITQIQLWYTQWLWSSKWRREICDTQSKMILSHPSDFNFLVVVVCIWDSNPQPGHYLYFKNTLFLQHKYVFFQSLKTGE